MCFWMPSTWASLASVFITMIILRVSFFGGGRCCCLVRPAVSGASLKVGPQHPGAVQIDVDDVAGALLGVHVEEDSQTHREGAWNVHLVSAEEGHVSPAHLPGGESGEFGVEVRAGWLANRGQTLRPESRHHTHGRTTSTVVEIERP